MRKWGFAVIFFMAFLLNANAADADDFVVGFYGAYDETKQTVTLEISVREEVSLEAFTFSVEYDEAKYELYEANDELPKGYGYDEAFLLSYRSGTALSNALAGKVLFSGVNASQDIPVYKGVIARVAFLCYPGYKADLSDMRLRVTVLHADGKRVDLPNQETVLECVERDLSSEKGQEGMDNSAAGGLISEAPRKTAVSGNEENKENPLFMQTASPYGQDALEQTEDKELLQSVKPVSAHAVVTGDGVEGELNSRAAKEKREPSEKTQVSADDKESQKDDFQNHMIKYGIAVFASVVIVLSGYILKRTYKNKKKRSREK